MSHTYTLHIGVTATSDADAKAKADAALLTLGDQVDYLHLTDADDWSEHVENTTCYCGEYVADRARNGTGKRTCAEHDTYPIADI